MIGNGDVQTSEDAKRLLEETQCDMVMVGRALTARPWLLWQLGEDWGWPAPQGREEQKAPRTAEEEGREFGLAQVLFLKSLMQFYPESLGLRRFRFFVTNSHQWLEFGHSYFKCIQKATTYEEMLMAVETFFAQSKRMSQRTDLRY